MKNLKLKGTLAVGLLSLTTLVGCGGTSSVSSDNTITFWHTFSKSIQNVLNRKIESFEKYIQERDGVEINIEQSPRGDYDSLADAIIKGYAVGTTPTLTVAYPDNVAYYLGLETNPGDFVVKLVKHSILMAKVLMTLLHHSLKKDKIICMKALIHCLL